MLYGGHLKSVNDVRLLKDLGFDFGEVILRNRMSRTSWLESGLINGSDSEWFVIAHGPREGPPNDLHNLWNRYLRELKETVDASRSIGITFLTVHLWMDPRFVEPEVVIDKVAWLKEVVAYGQKHNVLISLENLSENACDIGSVIAQVPDLCITLDVGHGQLLTDRNTSFDFIDRLKDHIGHVHLHDNLGGTGVGDDTHLPIGDGVIDFDAILTAFLSSGYEGTMTLELEIEDLKSSWLRIKNRVSMIRSRSS